MAKQETIDTLVEVSNAIDNLTDRLDPINDFGFTVGDELHNIHYQLERIADALEAIVKK
jgi:hypothetical protein